MPDWSYRTVFQPVLARLPFSTARTLALSTVGALGKSKFGRTVIASMGHMIPDPQLATKLGNVWLQSPTILSYALDVDQLATFAFTQFGLGMIEIGAVDLRDIDEAKHSDISAVEVKDDILDWQNRQVSVHRPLLEHDKLDTTIAAFNKLHCNTKLAVRVVVSSQSTSIQSLCDLIHKHAKYITAIVVEVEANLSPHDIKELIERLDDSKDLPEDFIFFIVQAFSIENCFNAVEAIASTTQPKRFGLWIDDLQHNGRGQREQLSLSCTDRSRFLSQFRERIKATNCERIKLATKIPLVFHVGLSSPEAAVDAIKNGATACAISSGFILSGPGIAKRINAAVLHQRLSSFTAVNSDLSNARPTTIAAWMFAFLLGAAMFFGGWLTLGLGASGVLLPYDEAYLGMESVELYRLMPVLIQFMAHDRITLSGTMIGLGIVYMSLAFFAIRRGQHWAMMTIWWSALCGFASFFLFLIFGYFDPLHAFVSAVLLQLTFGMIQTPLPPSTVERPTCIVDDTDWKMCQWGQLLLVIHGFAVCTAGLAICFVGSTWVFVQEDLEFMQASRAEIIAINPRLLGLVAHDRATFGGMLIACGVATVLPAMWGLQRGRRWLWWMLCCFGLFGYGTTLIVHGCVGYTDLKHLLPAVAGWILLSCGLGLCFRFLCCTSPENDLAWQK